jgi:hypothetical protein
VADRGDLATLHIGWARPRASGTASSSPARQQDSRQLDCAERGDVALQSPEELRRSLAELQAAVTAEREAAAAAEQRCRELANREQAIVKVRGGWA